MLKTSMAKQPLTKAALKRALAGIHPDPEIARELIDGHLSRPARRTAAQRQMRSMGAQRRPTLHPQGPREWSLSKPWFGKHRTADPRGQGSLAQSREGLRKRGASRTECQSSVGGNVEPKPVDSATPRMAVRAGLVLSQFENNIV